MVTGIRAARNICGETLDIWSANVDQSYHEEVRKDELEDRAVPIVPRREDPAR